MAQKLTTAEVRTLFSDYDALSDVKVAKSAILEQIAEGAGYGPYVDKEGCRFEIVKRKINGTKDYRHILRMLATAKDDVKL